MLMHSFVGTTAPQDVLDAVREGLVPAFCLFRHWNYESPEQLRQLTLALRAAAAAGGLPPPLIGVDQEGGQLIAIDNGATELPGNMALGATRSADLAEQAGRVLGRELLAMGVNLNFAPSLDVNNNPANPVIGTRSFGDDPSLVAELGVAMIRGLQAEGVIASAKHFPGHGDTQADSHHEVPVIAYPMERIAAIELAPFKAAVNAKVGAVITAHILFEALDAAQVATLSAPILTGLLRVDYGYEGLIMTDAMDMQAVARLGVEYGVREALNAGVDLVMLGHLPDQIALSRRTRDQVRPEALARIDAARQAARRDLPPLEIVGSAEHRQIAQTIADRSITLVRGALPLRVGADATIAVITTQPSDLTPADTSSTVQITLAEAIRRRHSRVLALELPRGTNASEREAVLAACADADCVIVATIDAYRDPSQQQVVKALAARGQQPIVVALRTPYDLAAFPEVQTYLCAYNIRAHSCEAVARALFGEIRAEGKLPCAIPGL